MIDWGMRNKNSCSQPGCDKPAFGRGLCSAHYQRARYHGELPAFQEKLCQRCGRQFSDRKWNSVFCSPKCRHAAAYKPAERAFSACQRCGTALTGKRTDARFCSTKCSQDHRNAQVVAATHANRRPCIHCGEPIPLHARRFCSKKCNLAHRRPEKYGLTRDELAALLDQHAVCAICKSDKWGRKGPQVDHDHATGRVRGILCVNCNTLLGHVRDDPSHLRAALDYLSG